MKSASLGRVRLVWPGAVLVLLGLVRPAAAQVQVRAVNGTIAGRVVDSLSGQPIPYALISFGGKRWFSTETGHFDLTGVTPGPVVLTVTQIAYAPADTRIDSDRSSRRKYRPTSPSASPGGPSCWRS